MKTTIYLPDSLLSKAKAVAKRKNVSLSKLVEETLRLSFKRPSQNKPEKKRLRLPVVSGTCSPGIDLDKSSEILSAQDVESFEVL